MNFMLLVNTIFFKLLKIDDDKYFFIYFLKKKTFVFACFAVKFIHNNQECSLQTLARAVISLSTIGTSFCRANFDNQTCKNAQYLYKTWKDDVLFGDEEENYVGSRGIEIKCKINFK